MLSIQYNQTFNKIFVITFLIFTLTVNSLHTKPKQSHLAFKDNLLVQNWYYGDLTPMKYRLRVF